MKQKILIVTGIILLLLAVSFMVKDLFFSGFSGKPNPYELNVDSIRKVDSIKPIYRELFSFQPALEEIYGICTGLSDEIFISGKDGVEVHDSKGKLKRTIPVKGNVLCIGEGPKGNLFLGVQDHVEIIDTSGRKLLKWKSESKESVITGIAVLNNDVFIADAGLKTVFHYTSEGKKIKRIGDEDPAKGIQSFIIPSPYFDLTIEKQNVLWVVNPGRHKLEKFDFEGNLLTTWGTASMAVEGFCGCCNPSNFAFLPDGDFVTSEKGIERVKIYDHDGNFKGMVAGPDQFDEGTRGIDLAVDSKARICLLDPVRKKIIVYVKKGGE